MTGKFASIGFIGAGVMGTSMARRLIDAGHQLHVHTRTRSRADGLLEAGASWAESPREVSHVSDIVISIVGHPGDVREVHLGEHGTLAASEPARFIIDMTTSTPDLAVEIAGEAQARGVESLDAPVFGGDIGAREGRLSVMVGANDGVIEEVQPVLEPLSSTVVHHGPPGSGQFAKIINQVLVASSMVGSCEGLLLARRAGLDLSKVIQTVGSGAAGSWTINNLGPRMIEGDFDPGFAIEHMAKDLSIALEQAKALGLDLPGLALAQGLYTHLLEAGHGQKGTHALFPAMEQGDVPG
ncbi:MAG: oxidoreductase [Phycisphaerae bacterium]|nr:oxidoreductase [Phycisphaerae bacterium]